jgi:hypothetical protein
MLKVSFRCFGQLKLNMESLINKKHYQMY